MVLNESKYIYNTLKPWSNLLDNLIMGIEFEMVFYNQNNYRQKFDFKLLSEEIQDYLYNIKLPLEIRKQYIDMLVYKNESDEQTFSLIQAYNNYMPEMDIGGFNLSDYISNNTFNHTFKIDTHDSYSKSNKTFSEMFQFTSFIPIPLDKISSPIFFTIHVKNLDQSEIHSRLFNTEFNNLYGQGEFFNEIFSALKFDSEIFEEYKTLTNNDEISSTVNGLSENILTDKQGFFILRVQKLLSKSQIKNRHLLTNKTKSAIATLIQLSMLESHPDINIISPQNKAEKNKILEQINPKQIEKILSKENNIELIDTLTILQRRMSSPYLSSLELRNANNDAIKIVATELYDFLIDKLDNIKDSNGNPFSSYEFLILPAKDLNDPNKFKIVLDFSIHNNNADKSDQSWFPLELVTPALPYKDQIIFQENFIKIMRRYDNIFEVNETTGMHVNISYDFESPQDMDFGVIQLFLDEEYYKQNFRHSPLNRDVFYQKDVLNKINFFAVLDNAGQIKDFNMHKKVLEIDYSKYNEILREFKYNVNIIIEEKNRSFHLKPYQIEFRILGNKYTQWENSWKTSINKLNQQYKLNKISKSEYSDLLKNIFNTQDRGVKDQINYFQFLTIQQYFGIDSLPTKLKIMQVKKIYNKQLSQLQYK